MECNCIEHIKKTRDMTDGYGYVYECSNCKKCYIKLDKQMIRELGLSQNTKIAEVVYIQNRWKFTGGI